MAWPCVATAGDGRIDRQRQGVGRRRNIVGGIGGGDRDEVGSITPGIIHRCPDPPTVRNQWPVALVAAWPRKVVPLSMICTLLNGSAVPVKVGVVALVLPGARVGAGGMAGAVIS